MYKKAFLFGVIGGLMLYFITIIEDVAYCAYALSVDRSSMVYIYFLLGILAAVIIVLCKAKSFIDSAIRFVAMMVVYILCVIVGGSIQLIPLLRSSLDIEVNSYVDNISGMVQLSFFAAVVVGGVIALISMCIKNICCKRE